MALTHPFHRPSLLSRRRPAGPGPAPDASPTPRADAQLVPGTRTPAGLPHELVVDEHGRPRRSVLLAAIMIRRGRSVAEISAATGLPAGVVTRLSRSV